MTSGVMSPCWLVKTVQANPRCLKQLLRNEIFIALVIDDISDTNQSASMLAQALRPSWFPQVTDRFLRAERFYNVATYLDVIAQDDLRMYERYGGKSLPEQSYGASCVSLHIDVPTIYF
jgi:hypothetical protein